MIDTALGVLHGELAQVTLRQSDALVMGRAVYGEEGPGASLGATQAITSTMMRRWTAINDARKRAGQPVVWRTFAELIQGTRQPGTGYCNPVQLWREQTPRRAMIARLTWLELSPAIREGVTSLFTGAVQLTQPESGAVHFAASHVVTAKLATHPDWRIVQSPAANTLVSDMAGRTAAEPWVVKRSAGNWWLTLFGILALAWSGWRFAQ